jgi:hypothetical protein
MSISFLARVRHDPQVAESAHDLLHHAQVHVVVIDMQNLQWPAISVRTICHGLAPVRCAGNAAD